MKISEKDIILIKENYPELNFSHSPPKIKGQFKFNATYDEKDKIYIKYPDLSLNKRFIIFEDVYEIEIEFIKKDNQLCPVAKEVVGRLERVAKIHGLDLADLHVNDNKTLCVAGPFDNYCELTLIEYIDKPLLQFFYDQRYFEQYGRWPRGIYSHGLLGLFENYIDRINEGSTTVQDELLKKFRDDGLLDNLKHLLASKIQGHHPCICNSGRIYRSCHPKVLKALWHLQDSIVEKK